MFAILSLFLLVNGQSSDQQPDASKGLSQLQGTWRQVGGGEDGRPITAEEAMNDSDAFVTTGDSLVVRLKGRVRGEFQFSAKPGHAKGEIDFKPVLRTLRESDYRGGVHIELSRHSHDAVKVAQRGLRFLRSCCP